MSCKNFDSQYVKKDDKRKENSKSLYENETSNADSLLLKKTSSNLDKSNVEKICKTSPDKLPAVIQNGELDIVKAKSDIVEEVDCERPQLRPATPQADRWEDTL